jgi:Zn-dependent M28 family amino/carboxypeptidase
MLLRGKSLSLGQTHNILVDKVGAKSDEVIMLGGHLDSVQGGPGINDNGTGSSALLEIAKQIAPCDAARTVRFAWWGAEEPGLVGSQVYVAGLSAAEQAALIGYLNFDMIGSPNHLHAMGHAVTAPGNSAQFDAFLKQDFEALDLPLVAYDLGVRSDHAPFEAAGVGVGVLSSGAEDLKTAALWGGTVGEPYDGCYHLACDTIDNVNVDVVEVVAKSMARAVQHFGIDGLL